VGGKYTCTKGGRKKKGRGVPKTKKGKRDILNWKYRKNLFLKKNVEHLKSICRRKKKKALHLLSADNPKGLKIPLTVPEGRKITGNGRKGKEESQQSLGKEKGRSWPDRRTNHY